MSEVLVLDRSRTAAALNPFLADPVALLDAVATALRAIGRGEDSTPPRIAARAPAGLLGAMPAHVPGLGLAAKLVSVFAVPDAPGRSAHRGVVALFDEHDGQLLALMDAEPLTAARTAAVATLSMRALARPNPARIAVIGAGAQARAQIALLTALHSDATVVVGARDPADAAALAAQHPRGSATGIRAAVENADVVFCCTGARIPVVHRSWLAPGTHISSVGGSAGPELDPDTVAEGTLFVEWAGAAGTPPPSGAHELQGTAGHGATLLGAVLDGRHKGRQHPDELTVFKSTGHGALDVAAAHVVHAFARTHRTGTVVDM